MSTDLAAGVPLETSLKTCVVATLAGRALGVKGEALAGVYFAALLRHIGCTAFGHEEARLGAGDDHAVLQAFETVDPGNKSAAAAVALRELGRGASIAARARSLGRFAVNPDAGRELAAAQCDLAVTLAGDLGLRDG